MTAGSALRPCPALTVPCLFALLACAAEPAGAPAALGAPPRATLAVFGHDMSRHPRDGLPHRPVIRVGGIGTGSPASTSPSENLRGAVWLLQGGPSDGLLRDLKRKPLTQARQGSAIPTDLSVDGTVLWLVPQVPLASGTDYTLALAKWLTLEGRAQPALPLAVALRTRGTDGGAALLSSLPAVGQSAVPADLAEVLLAFRGTPDGCGGLQLVSQPASAGGVDGSVAVAPCAGIDDRADLCCRWRALEPIHPGSRYAVRLASLRGPFGGPVAGPDIDFDVVATADGDAHPAPAALTCAVDEVSPGPGLCALATDDRVVLRVRVDEPLALWLRDPHSGRSRSRLVGPGEHRLSMAGLAPNSRHRWELTLTAIGNRRSVLAFDVETTGPLATVSIAEVRADPRGKEPDQEYVELWNYGSQAVDLSGFALADAPDSLGSRVGPAAPLAPGARALLVGDRFAVDDPEDAAPPPGARLIRMGRALAQNGLSNAGEPLFLRDAMGRRLSAAPHRPAPRPGICLVRQGRDPRSGESDAFGYDPNGTCTPGRAP